MIFLDTKKLQKGNIPVEPGTISDPAPQSSASPPEQLIYIGPHLPGGRLSTSFISLGGFPIYLEDIAESLPAIKDLFVPVAELSHAKKALNETGSIQQIAYSAVTEAIKGGI